jgi:hypothetical protein
VQRTQRQEPVGHLLAACSRPAPTAHTHSQRLGVVLTRGIHASMRRQCQICWYSICPRQRGIMDPATIAKERPGGVWLHKRHTILTFGRIKAPDKQSKPRGSDCRSPHKHSNNESLDPPSLIRTADPPIMRLLYESGMGSERP